jgi:hypothetical protein
MAPTNDPTKRAPQGLRGGTSGFSRRPGVRVMREYPCTSRELWTLGGLQAAAALTLSIAGWLFGFWVNSKQALALAGKAASAEILGQWRAYADIAFYAAICVGFLGLILIALSGFNVWGIIKDTSHD